MKYLLVLFILVLFLSCQIYIYELPAQVPSFGELGIRTSQFNTIEKIVIYVETSIKTIIKDNDCGTMPWDVMRYQEGNILDKCLLVAWMCEEAGLIEEAVIVSAGKRHAEKMWHVEDELGNPIWNYHDSRKNVYDKRGLHSMLYEYSQNPCVEIMVKG